MKRILLTALVAALIPLSQAGAFQILSLDEMQDSASFDGKYFQNYAQEADEPNFRFEVGGGNRANAYDRGPNYNSALRGNGNYGRNSGGMFGSSQQYCSSGSSSASMTALSYGVVNSYPCQRFR